MEYLRITLLSALAQAALDKAEIPLVNLFNTEDVGLKLRTDSPLYSVLIQQASALNPYTCNIRQFEEVAWNLAQAWANIDSYDQATQHWKAKNEVAIRKIVGNHPTGEVVRGPGRYKK